MVVYKCENVECKEQELQLVGGLSVGSNTSEITYRCPKCRSTYPLSHLEKQVKLAELLAYFQAQKSEYEVTKRYSSDQRATRFHFAKDNTHFMLDLSDNLIADSEVAQVQKQLEKSGWWSTIRSHPAPAIVTFSSAGFSFR